MSEIQEGPLKGAPLSEEEAAEQREGEPADTPTPRTSRSRVHDPSEIVEGKRTKKTVARLELQMSKPKEKLKVEDGGGDKLGDIPRTNHMIGKLKPGDLKPLHSIMFDRPGKTASMRKNMRQFNGFLFDVNSKQFSKKRDKLLGRSSLTNSKLRAICKVLDLEKKGSQSDLVNRILIFLSAPKNSGKPLLSKKKKRTKKRLSAGDAKSKPRPKSTSASPKKTKSGSKSKAIVMDSSSDDDEEEDEDEKTGTQVEEEEEEEEAKESGNEKEKTDDSDDDDGEEEEEEEDEEEEEEDESPKAKSPARKPAAGKRPRAPTKKSPAPRKRAKKALSESDSEADEKPKKKAAPKRAAPAKPAAKSKKADSSSNSKKTTSTVSEESSDDDRPLIKMVRVAPSDEQLKETVQSLLKDADLEEITMKQICQRVYDTYPDQDLASRKDYIKQTVKSLIT